MFAVVTTFAWGDAFAGVSRARAGGMSDSGDPRVLIGCGPKRGEPGSEGCRLRNRQSRGKVNKSSHESVIMDSERERAALVPSGVGADSQWKTGDIMTNPFDRGSSGPSPFGHGAPGPGPAGQRPDGQGVRGVPAPAQPAAPGPGRSPSGGDLGGRVVHDQNLDAKLRDLRRAADGMRAARERLASLVGTGIAADGRVRVTWAAATGLDQLDLDPRAMRMPSQDLSAAIKSAITDAMADLRRQTAEVLRTETGASAGGSVAKIEEMQETFTSQMDEITARIDEARRRMERALLR
jgi:DNA-binding protein YbaB